MPALPVTQDNVVKARTLSTADGTTSRTLPTNRMELLGAFLNSNAGYKWIVVATGYLTRYAEIKVLPKGSAAEVAKFLVENIVLLHGIPEVFITDGGMAFTADLAQVFVRHS